MPSSEQISLEPALTEVLAENLHYSTFVSEVDVVRLDSLHPDPLGGLEDGI
jgi:hypothetical protein